MVKLRHNVRVLFVSSMIVSPVTGGGNTTANLLESDVRSGEVFYASPKYHPPHLPPFPELSSRTCWFHNHFRPVPLSRDGRSRLIERLDDVYIARLNDWVQKEKVIKDVMYHVRRLRIDVLMFCPQNSWIDTAIAPELVERTGLPSVAWFMDDYYKDEHSRALAGKIWNNAHRRFVISEAMQEHFSGMYGGEVEVLNNSVLFPEHYPEPSDEEDSRLRIIYAGSMNPYYQRTMSNVLRELEELGDRVVLDIYSPDELPLEWRNKTDVPWRHLPLVPPAEVGKLLQSYDALLLLSSFEPEWRAVAETAQAGKMADYLAAGRCILAYGPEYAENIRYLRRHDIGETVTSSEPGALGDAVVALARDRDRRWELGKRAYHFGKEHRDRTANSARLWRALSEAATLPQRHDLKTAKKARILLTAAVLEVLNMVRFVRQRIRSGLKERRS